MGESSTLERLPTKREAVDILLSSGANVFLHITPYVTGVRVPMSLRNELHLILEIGFNMPLPIRDLIVDDEGLSATLSFDRQPHNCFVPWDAVIAVISSTGNGCMWPAAAVTQKKDSPKPKRNSPLRLVKDENEK